MAILRCPKCGSDNVEETCLGIITGPDINNAKCLDCRWEGIAEDCKAGETLKACVLITEADKHCVSGQDRIARADNCSLRRTPVKDEGENAEVPCDCFKHSRRNGKYLLCDKCGSVREIGVEYPKPTAPADEGEEGDNLKAFHDKLMGLVDCTIDVVKGYDVKKIAHLQAALAEKDKVTKSLDYTMDKWAIEMTEKDKRIEKLEKDLNAKIIQGTTLLRRDGSLQILKCSAGDECVKLKSAEAVVDALNLYIKEKTPRNSKDIDGDRVAATWHGMLAALSEHDKGKT